MANTLLSETLRNISNTLLSEIDSVNKDYAAEKITAGAKKDSIDCSKDIANYRTFNAIKSMMNDVLTTLKGERIDRQTYERIKDLFNEHL